MRKTISYSFFLTMIAFAFISSLPTVVTAQLGYKGVNLSGAEFGENNLPGTPFPVGSGPYDYIYPPTSEVDYFMDKGMNTFRLPFRWERMQQSLNGNLNSAELNRMNTFVDHTTAQGGHVILDPHNYARYDGDVIGGGTVTDAHFADFWTKMANEYKDNPRVVFGLVNEPNNMPTEDWLSAANASIAAIRDTGATNLIMVPGNGWSGAHGWDANYYGTPNADVMGGVVDPLNNFAFEVHQYLDSDSSGSTSQIVNQNIGQQRLVDFTQWLKDNNYRGFLGEVAVANSTIGNGGSRIGDEAIDNMLDYLESNDDVWMGWAWWGGGPWWGNYQFAIDPVNGVDRPSMDLLEPRLSAEDVFLAGDYSGNGFVDAADYTLWRNHLGTDTWLPGDTSPGSVTMQDYQVWEDFFGTERLPYALAAVNAVPEPDSLAIWSVLLFGLAVLRRSRVG